MDLEVLPEHITENGGPAEEACPGSGAADFREPPKSVGSIGMSAPKAAAFTAHFSFLPLQSLLARGR